MIYLWPWFLVDPTYKNIGLSFHSAVIFMKWYLWKTNQYLSDCWSLPLACFIVSLNSQKTCIWRVSIILILCGKLNTSLLTLVSHYALKLFARNKWQKENAQRGEDYRTHSALSECFQHLTLMLISHKSVVWSALPALLYLSKWECIDYMGWPYGNTYLLNFFLFWEKYFREK